MQRFTVVSTRAAASAASAGTPWTKTADMVVGILETP